MFFFPLGVGIAQMEKGDERQKNPHRCCIYVLVKVELQGSQQYQSKVGDESPGSSRLPASERG